ncbi:hypothetical protein GBA52_005507 [Prunus armeniaca]|nr:hypothetical protein GBA52_005507 [Prunus armeniaca]
MEIGDLFGVRFDIFQRKVTLDGRLDIAQPNQPNPSRGKRRGKGTTTGRGKGNDRGQMPNGRGNVGNGTTEMPNKPSSSQPLFYTGATSSSSQPPNIADIKRFKYLAKRFKSSAKKLRPWMF